jgi:NAD(P)H-hydrate epimerase
MDIVTGAEMASREKAAFAAGIEAGTLMEAAGAGMAARIQDAYPWSRDYLVLVGKGNNGGDGLVVARYLAAEGGRVRVVLAAPENELGSLPVEQMQRLRHEDPALEVRSCTQTIEFPGADGVVIDALLGVQARGPLRAPLGDLVARHNAARAERFFRTVALDLPSGLAAFEDAEAPKDSDAAIVADLTLAVGFAKEVLMREDLAPWVGRLEVVPWDRAAHQETARQALVPQELAGLLPRRSALSFKNDFGKLAIVAGSRGFTGAAVLCVQGAQGIGAGLLSVVTRAESAEIVAAQAPPEAMVSAWPAEKVMDGATAVVIGPGLGADDMTVAMLEKVLSLGCPVLVDADGLNALAKHPDLLKIARGPLILTPHVGEMGRLIGRRFTPPEREAVAREFVDRHGVTLVLKGTRTLIAQQGATLWINTTGNPGLSAGGTGDTLSGIIGGLLAQKLSALDAARLGVWLHGHAADLVLTERGCEEGLTATMLAAHLGAALASLRAQARPAHVLVEDQPG